MTLPAHILKASFTLIALALVCFFSCQSDSGTTKKMDEEMLKEPLIRANKTAAEIESEQIEAFVKRQEWGVTTTGTGLRYFVYRQGKGAKAEIGKTAKVNFEISLLNGTVCYSSKEKGPQQFRIGESEVESGLHEGITYLHVGDKAKLILPSHLAHGLIGDMNKIPPRSTIIYDIELLELK